MTALTLRDIAEQLPPGRTRARYERLVTEIEGGVMAVVVPGCDQPLWLVESPLAIPVLLDRGVARWRVWTLGEVQQLVALFGNSVRSLQEAAETLGSV